jgi:LmbE family N-acetylglucosaminyl deacetylase
MVCEEVTAAACQAAWRDLPIAPLATVIGSGTCMVLAPHPDDESLGCGGLIASCCAVGRPPLVAILTDGAASHPGSRTFPPERLRQVRAEEAREAVAHLGLPRTRLTFCGCPDANAPTSEPAFGAVVHRLCALIADDPNVSTILAPWRYDPHCDHSAAARIADEAALQLGLRSLAYPVWGWALPGATKIPARPPRGWRLDIEPFRRQKQRAIHAHVSQYGDLITDDPTGFRLLPELLSVFDSPYETFLAI